MATSCTCGHTLWEGAGKQRLCRKQRLDSVRKLHGGWAWSWQPAAAPSHDELRRDRFYFTVIGLKTRAAAHPHVLLICVCSTLFKSASDLSVSVQREARQLSLFVLSCFICTPCKVFWEIWTFRKNECAALVLKQQQISHSPPTYITACLCWYFHKLGFGEIFFFSACKNSLQSLLGTWWRSAEKAITYIVRRIHYSRHEWWLALHRLKLGG